MIYKTLNLHMARPYPKRSAGVAMVNALGGLSNLWASYLWYSPPHYYAAFGCREFSPRLSRAIKSRLLTELPTARNSKCWVVLWFSSSPSRATSGMCET